MSMKIAVLPGDGIGPEIVGQALRIVDVFRSEGLKIETTNAHLGGIAHDVEGHP